MPDEEEQPGQSSGSQVTGGQPPSTPKVLTITPASVSLDAWESQAFRVDPASEKVTWELLTGDKHGDGMQADGFYQAPKWIVRGRSVFIIARSADENIKPAVAKIELCSSSFWSLVTGAYWLLAAGLLVYGLLTVWPKLRGFNPLSAVNPTVVTLQAKGTQQFNAAGLGAPGNQSSVSWSINPNLGSISTGGLYRAPDEGADQTVTVSATAEGKPLGSATILLRKSRTLTISPSSALVPPSGKQTFTYTLSDPSRKPPSQAATPGTANPALANPAPATAAAPDACDASAGAGWNSEPVWSVTPSAGKVDNKGTYEAPSTIDRTQKVLVTVTKQCDSAAASVYLSNDTSGAGFGDPTVLIIAFVMIMGGLGSFVRAVSSFVAFAGNRQFVSSWTWWYILRPFSGGALAVIGYFLFAGGYIAAAGADTGNLIKIGVVAALIGLYEEQASVKLGEMFDALFKPSEKGKDQLGAAQPGAQGPVVKSVKQVGRTIQVEGAGFVKDSSKVLINGTAAKSTDFVSATQLNATLNEGDKGQVTVTVSNHSADGKDIVSPQYTTTLA
jgi:hypothetical protein